MTAGDLRAHMGEQHPAPQGWGKQLRDNLRAGQRLRLPAITRGTETPRLLYIHQTIGQPGGTQPHGRPLHFRQLITAAGHQQQRLLAVQLFHQHGTIAGQLLGLSLGEYRRPLTLGDDHAGQLAAGLIDRRQGRQHAVVVGREQHPHHVAHFPQQRLAEGGVLV